MGHYVELNNHENTAIGKVEFYEGTGYDSESDSYCFCGLFIRFEKAKYSDEILESTEIIFELWLDGDGDGEEWGEGVNRKQKHLTATEQSILLKNIKENKEEYVENYG